MFLKSCCDYLKINFPNVYIVIISGLITLWFRAFSDVAYHYIPRDTIKTKWIVLIVITALLYLGDNSLDELYKFEHPEAATVSGVQNEEDPNRFVKKLNKRIIRRR